LKEDPDIVMKDDALDPLTSEAEDYAEEDGWEEYQDEVAERVAQDLDSIDRLQETVEDKERRIAELKDQISKERFQATSKSQKLRLEIEKLEMYKTRYTQETEQLGANKTTLEGRLAKAQDKIIQLREQVQRLELDKQGLEQRLRIANDEMAHVKNLNTASKETTEIELKSLRSKLKSQASLLQQEEEVNSSLREQLNKARWDTAKDESNKATIQSLEKQLELFRQGDKDLAKLMETNRQLRFELEELRPQKQKLDQALKRERKKNDELEQQIQDMERDAKRRNKSYGRAKSPRGGDSAQASRLKQDLRDAKQEKGVLEAKYKNLEAQLKVLETSKTTTLEIQRNMINSLKSTSERLSEAKLNATKKLEAEVERLHKTIEEYRQGETRYESKIKMLGSDKRTLEEQLQIAESSAKQDAGVSGQERKRFKKQLGTLREQVSETRERNVELEAQLRVTKETLTLVETQKRTIASQLAQFEAKPPETDEQERKLRKQVMELRQQLDAAKLDTLAKQQGAAKLEDLLQQAESENRVLTKQLEGFKRRAPKAKDLAAAEKERLKAKVKTLESQLKESRGKAFQLESAGRTSESLVGALQEQLAVQEQECQQAKTEAKRLKRETQAHNVQTEAWEKERAGLKAKLLREQSKEHKATKEMSKTVEELEALMKEQKDLGAPMLLDLKRQNSETKQKLEKAEAVNRALGQKIKRFQRLRSQMVKIQSKIIKALERELGQSKMGDLKEGTDSWRKAHADRRKLERRVDSEKQILVELQNLGDETNDVKAPERNRPKSPVTRTIRGERPTSPSFSMSRTQTDMEASADPERRVSELKGKLNVERELSKVIANFQHLRQKIATTGATKELLQGVKQYIYTLNLIQDRLSSARKEASLELQLFQGMKTKVMRQITTVRRSSSTLAMREGETTRLNSTIANLRKQLGNSRLKTDKKAKLAAELAGLELKKQQAEMRSAELRSMQSKLTRLESSIGELTNLQETALKEQLRITTLVNEARALAKREDPNADLDDSELTRLGTEPQSVVTSMPHTRRGSLTISQSGKFKPCCPHCNTLNTVDYDAYEGLSFQVNCWNCDKLFLIDQFPRSASKAHVGPLSSPIPAVILDRATASPRSVRDPRESPRKLSRIQRRKNSRQQASLSDAERLKIGANLRGRTQPQQQRASNQKKRGDSYPRIEVRGLPPSLIKKNQLLQVFFNETMKPGAVVAWEQTSGTSLLVQTREPSTQKDILRMQGSIGRLKEAMRKRAHFYEEELDKITFHGAGTDASSRVRPTRAKSSVSEPAWSAASARRATSPVQQRPLTRLQGMSGSSSSRPSLASPRRKSRKRSIASRGSPPMRPTSRPTSNKRTDRVKSSPDGRRAANTRSPRQQQAPRSGTKLKL